MLTVKAKKAVRACLAVSCLLAPVLASPQQANVNLDYNPQKNAENLIPFSASLNFYFRFLPNLWRKN